MLREYITEVVKGFGSFNSYGAGSAVGNLRYNDALTAARNKGVLDDEADDASREKQDRESLPRAACVLIIADDGKILAVSRKDDPSDMGLPGGKVDPGEDDKEAAARELEEETGFVATRMRQVFADQDEGGFMVTTFAAEVEGEIDTDESGTVRWVDPSVLLQGSFKGYNLRLLKSIGRMK